MRRYVILLVSTLLVALTVIPQVSYALGLEIGAGYSQHELSGDFAYKSLSSIDKLDTERDLGYDKEYALLPELKLNCLYCFLIYMYLQHL